MLLGAGAGILITPIALLFTLAESAMRHSSTWKAEIINGVTAFYPIPFLIGEILSSVIGEAVFIFYLPMLLLQYPAFGIILGMESDSTNQQWIFAGKLFVMLHGFWTAMAFIILLNRS